MQTINLLAYNNQDYRLTLDMTAWVNAGFDIGTASGISKHAATAVGQPSVLSWSNQGYASQGLVTRSGNNLVFTAPAKLVIARASAATSLVYDCRIITSDGRVITMFGGSLQFAAGVSK